MSLLKSSLLVLTILLISCVDNIEDQESEAIRSAGNLQTQAQITPEIDFKHLNTEKYFEWVADHTDHDVITFESIALAREPEAIGSYLELFDRLESRIEEESEENRLSEREQLEYRFLTKIYRSTLYQNRYGVQNNSEDVQKAIHEREQALKLLDGKEEYQADRAFPELTLVSLECYQEANDACFDSYLRMIEEYEESPYGDYSEWFVSNFVIPGFLYHITGSEDNVLRERGMDELEKLSEKNSATGISSRTMLARHFLAEGDVAKAGELIRNSPDNLEDYPEDIRVNWENLKMSHEEIASRH